MCVFVWVCVCEYMCLWFNDMDRLIWLSLPISCSIFVLPPILLIQGKKQIENLNWYSRNTGWWWSCILFKIFHVLVAAQYCNERSYLIWMVRWTQDWGNLYLSGFTFYICANAWYAIELYKYHTTVIVIGAMMTTDVPAII